MDNMNTDQRGMSKEELLAAAYGSKPPEKEMEVCVICKRALMFHWTDSHGVGVCGSCNAPYRVAGYHGKEKNECMINDEYIEKTQEWWEKTGHKPPAGQFYMGRADPHMTPDIFDKFCEFLGI